MTHLIFDRHENNRRVLRGKIINKPTAYGYKWKFEDNLDL